MSRRKPKRHHPCAPTGYPTPADAAHTAHVEAAKDRRETERQERRRAELERREAMTPEARAAERFGEARLNLRSASPAGPRRLDGRERWSPPMTVESRAAEHSTDLLVYTSPNPSRTSPAG